MDTVAVDWGTSSLRVWLLDRTGAVLGESRSAEGADGLGPGAFEACLTRHIERLGAAARGVRVVMCGMVGARNGWREAPYMPIPARLDELPGHAMRVAGAGVEALILPGLVRGAPDAPDVMRGEETQLLGFSAAAPDFNGLACLPGTHCKWVRMRGGTVDDFYSAMTGEIFRLLAQHSVLRHVVAPGARIDADDPEFLRAAAAGLARPEALLHTLFSVRAAALVAGLSAAGAAARLSGLLIGADIGAALREVAPGTPVSLIASGAFVVLYERIFGLAGVRPKIFDADEMVRAGLLKAARLWNEQELRG
jgi:2-dehydro-3-deoxygalactonokinase